MAIALITEVMDFAPATLTPQERVAAMVFAEDAWLHPNPADHNHDRDRHIRTPLTDEMFQRRIGVGSAKKVLELAQALARKGVLENVTRGQKWQRAEYKFAYLTPSQQPGKWGAETENEPATQQPENRGPELSQSPRNRGAEGSQQPGKWGAAYIPPSSPSSCTPEEAEEEDANAFEPHPDAVAILGKVDLGGKVLVLKLRLEAERILTAKIAEGWTVSALLRAFDGCAVGATNPPGAFMSRVRGLGVPPQSRDSPAPNAVPKCSECNADRLVEDDYGTRTPCPTCHPKRKAHP